MYSHSDLPEELIEHLERYCDGRCPALASNLLEELAVMSQTAETEIERCTSFSLLRHWLGVDRSRIEKPASSSLSAYSPHTPRWRRLSIVTVDAQPGHAVNES